MAEFKWRSALQDWGREPKELILSLRTGDSSRWYATLKWNGENGCWHLTIRGGFFWIPLDYTDRENPPKEYAESMVLLAHDIGDING